MKFVYIYIILAIMLIISGCVNVPAPAKTSTDSAVTTAGANGVQSTNTDTATLKKCEEAVNYQVLIDALPKEVNGYVGGEPEGSMLTFTDPQTQQANKYSTAKVTLMKEDKTIDVTATDTCYIQYLSMMWLGYYEMEGTNGYLKKTTMGGFPGWHQYDKQSNQYSYNIFVKERVIVTVQGSDGVADSDVEAVAKAVNYASIAAAAK